MKEAGPIRFRPTNSHHGPATYQSRSKPNSSPVCELGFCFRCRLQQTRAAAAAASPARRGGEGKAAETRDRPRWGSRRAARPAAAWRRRWCRTPRAPSPPSVSAATTAPSVWSPLRPPTPTSRSGSPRYAFSLFLP